MLYYHMQLALAHKHHLAILSQHPTFCPYRTPESYHCSQPIQSKSILHGIQKHQPVTNYKRLTTTSAIYRDISTIFSRSPLGFIPILIIHLPGLLWLLRPSEFTFSVHTLWCPNTSIQQACSVVPIRVFLPPFYAYHPADQGTLQV